MKKNILITILLSIFLGACESRDLEFSEKKSVKSYSPAAKWEDAMLTGNGMEGMMVYGHPYKETIIFNSHKFLLPNGAPYPIPDMSDMVEPMQKMMLEGKIGEGWKLYHLELLKRQGIDISKNKSSYAGMLWSQSFHPGYELHLDFNKRANYSDFVRYTDYQTGEVVVKWTDEDGMWERRSFASRNDDLLITSIKAPKGASISAKISCNEAYKSPKNISVESIAKGEYLRFRAKYPEVKGKQGGYEGYSRIVPVKGQLSLSGDSIVVSSAKELLILTKLERYKDDYSQWNNSTLKSELENISDSYEELLKPHKKIQADLYNRVDFSLFTDLAAQKASSEELLADEEADETNISQALLEKLFYTSRYLFIASCGEQYGPRLSGMFLGAWGAAWAGDYTCDANVNLAVLGGNIANLPECMEGYYKVIERSLPQWRDAATKLYGCRGILGPVRIDGEVGIPLHVASYHAHITATGLGPWLLYPMFEYYKISGDKDFLKQRLYPLLKEQALFYEDFLKYKDEDGKYIFVPSNSPENAWEGVQPRSSASINSTMDIAACKHSLQMLLYADEALGLDSPEKGKWEEMLSNIPSYLVNSEGALQEWSWPGHGENYSHRHSSHMLSVWPSYDINPENPATKELIPNVSVALDKRKATIVHAHDALMKSIARIRIKEGEGFYENLKYLMEKGYFYNSLASSHDLNHHIYNYDLILSLQGMLIEMLVFTKDDVVELLPALPKVLRKGEINGVKGRNQITFNSIKWDMDTGNISCSLVSKIEQNIKLIFRKGMKSFTVSSKVNVKDSEQGAHIKCFKLKPGEEVSITIEM